MSLILLVLGILFTAAGVGLVGFGILIKDLNVPIVIGTLASMGGLLLISLSAVLAELRRVGEVLRTRLPAPAGQPAGSGAQVAQPARPARPVEAAVASTPETVAREPQLVGEPHSAAAAPPGADAPASSAERMRSSVARTDKVAEVEEVPPLSPNGQQAHDAQPLQHAAPSMDASPREPAAPAAEAAREPKLDLLFRQRQQRPAPPQQPEFDSVWPKRGRREPQSDSRAEVARAPSPPPMDASPTPAEDSYVRDHPTAAPLPPPAPAERPRSAAILKSGVVDGMAYTLYADGSIEAQLPQGMVRFGSIAELRAHIENNSHA